MREGQEKKLVICLKGEKNFLSNKKQFVDTQNNVHLVSEVNVLQAVMSSWKEPVESEP